MNKEIKEPIRGFCGKWRFLSNFWEGEQGIMEDHELFPTAEHLYQFHKAINDLDRMRIVAARTPGTAKRIGRCMNIRTDWDYIKQSVMLDVVRAKFFQDPALANLLLETGDRELIEENSWGDTFWGTTNGVGENNLGKILMLVRNEIRTAREGVDET